MFESGGIPDAKLDTIYFSAILDSGENTACLLSILQSGVVSLSYLFATVYCSIHLEVGQTKEFSPTPQIKYNIGLGIE